MALRIGIVGTGRTVGIAASHAAAISRCEGAELTAVHNRTREGAEAFVQRFNPAARVCGTYEELLAQVDAVVVCTPNRAHVEHGIAAIRAGKALFLEKPIAVNPAAGHQLALALAEKPVFAMVGYVYRYAPHTQALRALVRERLGRVYTLSGSFGGTRLADPTLPLEWRMLRDESGAGALADFGSHMLDLARFTCGLEPRTLSCHTQTAIPQRPASLQGQTHVENDDSAVVSGCGAGGELFSFLFSRVGMDAIHLCVTGEGGLVRADFSQNHLLWLPKQPGGAYTGEAQTIPLPEIPQADWFLAQMRDFVAGAGGAAVEACSIEQGLCIEHRLSEAAQSARHCSF